MQKALRRNLLARNQALKSSRRKAGKSLREERRTIRQETVLWNRAKRSDIKAERENRREDWMLGPLAPNRLAGQDGGGYGMLNFQSVRPPVVFTAERERYFNFAVNDRVVVVKGREKGKIGKIKEVDQERQTVALFDVNIVDVKVPGFMREQSNSKVPYQPFPMPISIQDVRLVVPLRDNATGKIKDTVVDHLRGGEPVVEREYGSDTPKHTRYIAGPNTVIPWPKGEIVEMKAEAADTRRVDVDEESFSASLAYLPLPKSAVNELRSKYSRTRSVNTQEYVRQKMKEDAEEQWKEKRRMVLPKQEYWEHKAKQKEVHGRPEVTKETLDVIRDMQAAKSRAEPAS